MRKPTRAAVKRLQHLIVLLERWQNAQDAGQRLDHGDAYYTVEAKTALMLLLDKLEAGG